jgi:hypothetical protein
VAGGAMFLGSNGLSLPLRRARRQGAGPGVVSPDVCGFPCGLHFEHSQVHRSRPTAFRAKCIQPAPSSPNEHRRPHARGRLPPPRLPAHVCRDRRARCRLRPGRRPRRPREHPRQSPGPHRSRGWACHRRHHDEREPSE